jgi:hypothetical protein
MSVPLGELGVKTPPAAGTVLRLEIEADDLDVSQGAQAVTRMTTGGNDQPQRNTETYARCKFQ